MTHTPTIQMHAENGGYNISVHEDETSLPDGYTRIVIVCKSGDSTVASLTRAELGVLRDRINDLLAH